MAKKGPLSKIEKFYIEHNHEQMTVEDFCKTLDRAKGIVKKYVAECKSSESDKSTPFIHQNGSTVMTKAASEIADHNKGRNSMSAKRAEKCVTRMKNG